SEALRLTAPDILELKVIDEIIPEPVGGAHRDPTEASSLLKRHLTQNLRELRRKSTRTLIKERFDKFMNMGVVDIVTGS
ncbi:MAG: acetyl-CoA carboxylase carboxyl transferase subunit alpha, partial [Magnetococcales bacterium]|nr:acetyl-CoA carboxylase carboxyl transferase subunit alpha [Magnetococcales bacterium]